MAHDGAKPQVTFQDHGAGISASDLPRIFDRFYRGDPSRTRATGGFGLGLAIVKALVEAYGGTIAAESAPGKGTRMTVELPVRSNRLSPPRNPASASLNLDSVLFGVCPFGLIGEAYVKSCSRPHARPSC